MMIDNNKTKYNLNQKEKFKDLTFLILVRLLIF